MTEPLRVGSAFPDPPFDVPGPPRAGLDHDLMEAIGRHLGRPVVVCPYEGADSDGIFAELGRSIDVVASGATVTDHRRTLARWCRPYVRSGQSLVVDTQLHPHVHGTDDLAGLVIGVQKGNTSEPVARALHAKGAVEDVKVYDYDGIVGALDDLESGAIGAFMKLEPVMRWLTADRPTLGVVQTGITDELLAVAVPLDDTDLAEQIDRAQDAIRADGQLRQIGERWLHGSDPAATGVVP
jgi:ABC-type amino acid transport substrate-binding protein